MTIDSTSSSTFNTIHRKQNGTITLSDTHLSFVNESNDEGSKISLTWMDIAKHQVSPASHPKALLKLVLSDPASKGLTFQFENRDVLENIRSQISAKLAEKRTSIRKRQREEATDEGTGVDQNTTGFNQLASDALAVSRAALLASNENLREQYKILVEGGVLSEDEFWSAHERKLADEAAKVHGKVRKGIESTMRSNLDLTSGGKIRLGVEEIRQIFILYPAVHKAYEEKVPLELSEEQFWRKYLESEYFYRDRGHVAGNKPTSNRNGVGTSSVDHQDHSQAAVAGAEDIFSRYDVELMRERDERESLTKGGGGVSNSMNGNKKIGREQAVGQFDLSQSMQTERPTLGSSDLYPTTLENSQGSRVIKKYNRHWALVMNPEKASATSSFVDVAMNSVRASPVTSDANGKRNGDDFERLVSFASCSQTDANHVRSRGDEEFEELSLQNIDVYSNHLGLGRNVQIPEEKRKMVVLAQTISSKLNDNLVEHYGLDNIETLKTGNFDKTKVRKLDSECLFPDAQLSHQLLLRLTKHMNESTKTETDTAKLVRSLPEKHRSQIELFFHRSAELLRHFYGLLMLEGTFSKREDSKLNKIVEGIKQLYLEIEGMRKVLLGSGEEGEEVMRKLCLGMMDQLDYGIKKLQQRRPN